MARGRPRKPTQLKVLKGTMRPCRENPDEPKLATERLRPPEHLARDAVRWWGYLASCVDPLRCTTKADVAAFEHMVDLKCMIENTKRSERGMDMKASAQYSALLGRFGMTPADRSKVSAAPETKRDELDDFAVGG